MLVNRPRKANGVFKADLQVYNTESFLSDILGADELINVKVLDKCSYKYFSRSNSLRV